MPDVPGVQVSVVSAKTKSVLLVAVVKDGIIETVTLVELLLVKFNDTGTLICPMFSNCI